MIVYRETQRSVEPGRLLRELERSVAGLGARPSHDAIVESLVDLGIAESAILDAIHPTSDEESELDRRFRTAAVSAGRLLVESWRGRKSSLQQRGAELLARIRAIRDLPLPSRCVTTVPEGFAHYGVWPEAYAASAERLFAELRPIRAWVLGLRSIGAPLSAVVTAALEGSGCDVLSHTLRPRGHPFARRPVVGSQLTGRLRADASSAHFLIVDEGPGLSGSSFTGVAEALARLGVPDERIVLMPSWITDGAGLNSDLARRRWPRHPQFATSFDSPWPAPAPPKCLRIGEQTVDLSAGRWRERLIGRGTPWPAVHPQHERRKLTAGGQWVAFAGLGKFGRRTFELQAGLAEAGFVPPPRALEQGMLIRDMVQGTPLVAKDCDGALLARIAAYLSHRARHVRVKDDDREALRDMALSNVEEALGGDLARAAEERLRSSGFPGEAPAVALDARMQPHEWLRTSSGMLKTDATDHHVDHFFPGCGDIAWDLAGAVVEFNLPEAARDALTRQYRQLSGDRTMARRLPGYLVAYLAFRTAYASLAAETLANTDDGTRFATLSRRYIRMLRRELGARTAAAARA
ncbi:MAG: hypothetical protein ACJ8DJ_05605 [Gemmatimonadales bacterium]